MGQIIGDSALLHIGNVIAGVTDLKLLKVAAKDPVVRFFLRQGRNAGESAEQGNEAAE
jgi:hypothetical protein